LNYIALGSTIVDIAHGSRADRKQNTVQARPSRVEWEGAIWSINLHPYANKYWGHSSACEPNLIYHAGKWKLRYVPE